RPTGWRPAAGRWRRSGRGWRRYSFRPPLLLPLPRWANSRHGRLSAALLRHVAGHRHAGEDRGDREHDHDRDGAGVLVHDHLGAQHEDQRRDEHVGCDHPVEDCRPLHDTEDACPGREGQQHAHHDQNDVRHFFAASSRSISSNSSLDPSARTIRRSTPRTVWRPASTSSRVSVASTCTYSTPRNRSASTTSEPGTSEIAIDTRVMIRSERLRSCTATTELLGTLRGSMAIQATSTDARNRSTVKWAAKTRAHHGLNRPERASGGR